MPVHRAFAVPACLFALITLTIPSVTIAATKIGLYTDEYGSSCTFSGNQSGVVTAFVVFKPDENGIRGVRFSAPIPECLGAVLLTETPPEGALMIGSTQNGVSVAFPFCAFEPGYALRIEYMRTSTTACCEFPILADPFVGIVEGTDCAFNSADMTPVVGKFNADASCPCSDPNAPYPPYNPFPFDNSVGMAVNVGLSWLSSVYDGDIVGYDVYLGTSPTPDFAATVTNRMYQPPQPLLEFTRYYWRVVIRDAEGLETSGPVWTFTTGTSNYPPLPPASPTPADNATSVSVVFPALYWTVGDPEHQAITSDVYFGTSPTPPLVASDLGTPSYPLPRLDYGTLYYWRIVARDALGAETQGDLWSFWTRPENYPPTTPTNPSPANNASGVSLAPTLAWASSDPDADDILTFDVYFGSSSPPPLVASNVTSKSYALTGLSYLTAYYWKIVARDNHGAEAAGSEWSFTTRLVNYPPSAATAQSPTQGMTNVNVNADIYWQCTDPDGDALTFEVYFGTTSPPPLVASNVTIKSYDVGVMSFYTTYYWKIVAKDPTGLTSTSSIFNFRTEVNDPPGTPSNPNPINSATGIVLNPTLSWTCTDEFPSTLKYDVYFGTSTSPPLVASNHTTNSYSPGPLTFATTYRWKIVARDAQGLERTGPVWVFYTVAAPAPNSPNPADNTLAGAPLTLAWSSSNPNNQSLHCDLYYGATNPPPLVASGISPTVGSTGFRYSPAGDVTSGAPYYWQVYAYDNYGGSMGPVWSFTGALRGDTNLDGSITLADASCALQIALGNGSCAQPGASGLADVNCAPGVTPRDALCIHRRAIGQTCLFCGESFAQGASPNAPVVTRSSYWQTGNTLYIVLAVSGVANLEAFSFHVVTPGNAALTAAIRRGATADFTALAMNYGTVSSSVGGYSLAPADASSATDFITLQFNVGGTLTSYIAVDNFVDDLAGAGSLTIMSGTGKGGGGLPVTFTRFDAQARDGGVRVDWELRIDDVIDDYTLYRAAEGDRTAVAITEGPVEGTTGSYLDLAVDAGKTYRYEMLVRATDGDEFRSPIVSVEVPALGLTLGHNHPNPFNPQTTIPYGVPVGGPPVRVRLVIYDAQGRAVRTLVDESQTGGARDVVWNGTDSSGKIVTSGVYFCVLQVGKERRAQKLVLLK
jgi:hypothetical protein